MDLYRYLQFTDIITQQQPLPTLNIIIQLPVLILSLTHITSNAHLSTCPHQLTSLQLTQWPCGELATSYSATVHPTSIALKPVDMQTSVCCHL